MSMKKVWRAPHWNTHTHTEIAQQSATLLARVRLNCRVIMTSIWKHAASGTRLGRQEYFLAFLSCSPRAHVCSRVYAETAGEYRRAFAAVPSQLSAAIRSLPLYRLLAIMQSRSWRANICICTGNARSHEHGYDAPVSHNKALRHPRRTKEPRSWWMLRWPGTGLNNLLMKRVRQTLNYARYTRLFFVTRQHRASAEQIAP